MKTYQKIMLCAGIAVAVVFIVIPALLVGGMYLFSSIRSANFERDKAVMIEGVTFDEMMLKVKHAKSLSVTFVDEALNEKYIPERHPKPGQAFKRPMDSAGKPAKVQMCMLVYTIFVYARRIIYISFDEDEKITVVEEKFLD